MKKRRIIYTVDVDFTDQVPDATVHLWVDGIARGIEHNKPEVKHIEYDIQERDLPEVERQSWDDPATHARMHHELTEQEMRSRLELPSGEDD